MSDSIVKIGFDIATKSIETANAELDKLLDKAVSLDSKLKGVGKSSTKGLGDVVSSTKKVDEAISQSSKQVNNLSVGMSSLGRVGVATFREYEQYAKKLTREWDQIDKATKKAQQTFESYSGKNSFGASLNKGNQVEVQYKKELGALKSYYQAVEAADKKAEQVRKNSFDREINLIEKAKSREQKAYEKDLANMRRYYEQQERMAARSAQPPKNVVSVSFKAKPFDDGYVASAKNATRANEMLGASFLSLGGIIGQVGFAFVAQRLIEMADGYALLQSRMKLFSNAGDDLAVVNQRLLSIANANRASLEDTGRLYVKLLQPLRELGSTSEEVLTVTDAFSKALFVGGANAREASAAIIQFSQAMASGKLSGDEFRSITEAAPNVLYALKDALGKTGAELKKMSADQQLTTNIVSGSLLKSMAALEIQAKSLGPTVGQAANVILNNMVSLVGEFDQATGASKAWATSLISLANKMMDLGRSFNEFYTANKDAFSTVFSLIGDAVKILVLYKGAMLAVNLATKAYVAVTAAFGAINFLWNVAKLNALAYASAVTATTVAVGLYKAAMIAVGKTVTDVDAKTSRSFIGLIGKAVVFTATMWGLNEAMNAALAPRDTKNLFKDVEEQNKQLQAKLNAFQNKDPNAEKVSAKIDVMAQYKKEYEEALTLAGANKQLAKSYKDQYDLKVKLYDEQQKRGQELIDMGSKGGKDDKAAKEATDKLAQMKEFSAQYATQIADQQRINALVSEGKTIEDARYKVELDRQLIDARKSGATEKQISDMRAALEVAKQQTDAAKEYEEALKLIQDVEKEVASDRAKDLEDFAKAKEDFLKPEKFEIGDLFGEASKSAGAFINALQEINERQEEYVKLKEKAKNLGQSTADIDKRQKQAELRGIGSILGATKGFFKEKSAGYKVLSAAEKAFRILEIAEALKTFTIKTSLFSAETIAKVTGLTAQEAAEKGFTLVQVAEMGVRAAASSVAALAESLVGPFPANLAAFATVAAILGGLGLAVGGSKAKGSFAPTNEGTGTVFGDKSAKSESIKKSIDLLAENSKIELPLTSAMLRSLQNIEANIGGVTNLIIRGGAGDKLASGVKVGDTLSGFGSLYSKVLSPLNNFVSKLPIVGNIFGGLLKGITGAVGKILGSTKVSIKGQGLFGADQSLSSINSQGFNLKEYVDVNVKKKAFGITTSSKNSTKTGAASEELSRQFSLIFKGFYDSIKLAVVPLGQNLSEVASRLDSFVVKIGKIDLKGLKGDEIQAKLEAVFGAAADSIAQAAIPGLEDFQKVGEGYFETVIRVSSGIEQANQALSLFGVSAVNFKDILLKQGDIGAEIVRQSLVIANGISGVSDILSSASVDSVDAIVELANTLYSLRDNVIAIGNGFADVTVSLIKGAGSVDRLSSGLDSFFNDFLSTEEQSSELARRVARDFTKLGVVVPASKEAFKLLVQGIDTTTNAGQELFGQLIALAPAFSEMSSAAEDAGSSLNDVARSLYETIRDARLQSLIPTQQLDVLLSEYQSAVNLATQSTGQNLADNAGTVNGLINPLLESIKSVYASGPEAQRLIDSVLGQAKNVADKAAAESFTFQDESLRLLQAQVNELEAIRSALNVGVFTPINVGASNVVPFVAPPSSSVNVNVQNGTDNSGIILALTESNAHAAALVRLQQSANQQIIQKLTEVEARLDGLESAASLAASA